ncbi:MAG: hypothetical protein OWU84_14740 [Firmicutes bacterium]|jgi:hypothetical protein|nr:hypothetical protein [Bacillota bacterium]
MDMWTTIALAAAKTVLPFAMAALTGFITKGWQYLITQEEHLRISKNAKANAAIREGLEWATTEAKTVVEDAINMVNQTLVNDAKARGTWTEETAQQAFRMALTAAEKNLSLKAKDILGQQYPMLKDYLALLIESRVPLAATKTTKAAS